MRDLLRDMRSTPQGRLALAALGLAVFAIAAFVGQWRVESATVSKIRRDANVRARDLEVRLQISYEGCKASAPMIERLNDNLRLFKEFAENTAAIRAATAPHYTGTLRTLIDNGAVIAADLSRGTVKFPKANCEYLNPKHPPPPPVPQSQPH